MRGPSIWFTKSAHDLVLNYLPRDDHQWVRDRLADDSLVLKGTFHLRMELLVNRGTKLDQHADQGFDDDEEEAFSFRVAEIEGDYFKFDPEVLGVDVEVLIHRSVSLDHKAFVAERNVSLFGRIAELRPTRIVIGGDAADAIPEAAFQNLLEKFPTPHELRRYVLARVASVVRDHVDTSVDAERLFQNYVDKRLSKRAKNFRSFFRGNEIQKYRYLHEKLQFMLKEEAGYSEAAWQAEIIQIVLLLNPKYIKAFPEAPVKDVRGVMRRVDMLLVDASGNIDVVELKKPFDKAIVSGTVYRDNYIPMRELSGSVMQMEKYIFYLNKWGQEGEEALTRRYASDLPESFKVKITNPGGLVIMGRDNNLSDAQRLDFEVIRRKYKNVIDIITYDDLLGRLDFILRQLEREAGSSHDAGPVSRGTRERGRA